MTRHRGGSIVIQYAVVQQMRVHAFSRISAVGWELNDKVLNGVMTSTFRPHYVMTYSKTANPHNSLAIRIRDAKQQVFAHYCHSLCVTRGVRQEESRDKEASTV